MISLDPPKGDYVRYIEQIQSGKVLPQGGIKAPDFCPDHKKAIEIEPYKKNSPASITPSISHPESRRAQKKDNLIIKVFGAFVVFTGIACIGTGLWTEIEPLIPVGMFTLFFGLILFNK